MKTRYISHIIAFLSLAFAFSCVSDPDIPSDMINAKVPEVKTHEIEKQTAASITVSAEVLKENGMPVTDYGVYWSKGTTKIDTTKAQKVSVGKGKGTFTVTIEKLDKDSEYHVVAYAQNKKGIGLGEEQIGSTTTGAGSVSTLDHKDNTATTVVIGGKIGVKGEGDIKNRGVYLSVTPEFTTPDTIIFSTMTTDSFTCHVTNLSPNTKYYYKAFVENQYSIFHGGEKTFTTTDGLPLISTLTATEISFYYAKFKAEVEEEGDSAVSERG